MSLSRFSSIYRLELSQVLKRPMLWILIAVLLFVNWGFAQGNISIQSGDSSVGGTKAWVTSEFSFAFFIVFTGLIYNFFISILSGMSIIHDDDLKVGEILHATPLRISEYVWGKFLAILTAFGLVVVLHLVAIIFFSYALPSDVADEIRGPFGLINYLRPTLVFLVPLLLFVAGVAFFLGERSRRPITVFLLPVALFLILGFFLWNWSPTWLAPEINRVLMLIEPSGFRWLEETWLKLDLGATYYNVNRVGLDTGFVISRIVLALLGFAGVVLAQRHLTVRLRGEKVHASKKTRAVAAPEAVPSATAVRPLAALGMTSRPPGLWEGALATAGTEVKNLLFHPGIYLFLTLILFFTLGNSLVALGPFEENLLLTAGQVATASMGSLAAMVCLLLLFYTVESLERDRSTGLASISFATPVKSASLLLGRSLANSLIGVLAILAAFVACAIAVLIQGKVPLSLTPFLLVWGLLLIPTFILWTSFVTVLQATLAQRYLTYGIGLGVMALMGYFVATNRLNWVTNWGLWGEAVPWSDFGVFEIDGRALLLSRILALGLAVFFIALSVRAFARQEADAIGLWNRIQPGQLGRGLLRLSPFLVVPLVAGIWLSYAIFNGLAGGRAEKKGKDYWVQNLGTWKDAPQPALVGVELDLKIDPADRHLESKGRYDLVNDEAEPLSRFALTGGMHWKNVRWTVDGKEHKPQDRSGLYVFEPQPPLPPGGRVTIGFEFEGTFPQGITKNGGSVSEFVLPSGVVLTGFSQSMAPTVGYDEGIGVDPEKNQYEPRVYPPDFYEERLDPAFTSPSSFTTRIRIDGPADFTFNSVGTRVEEKVEKGRRIVVWQSDYPVRLFNVVGGRWKVRERGDTRVFYFPGHPYNIDEISEAAAAARRYYSEWFYPYPWRELKISEFPAHASYAQGFPTNISFSEGIGFLTKSSNKTHLAFMVAAHESAHQWWGNILTPGKGPGGNVLSEGMSHFSTLLLLEQVKGLQARIEFAKRIEERYGDRRRVDAERPLVEIDGFKAGDQTVTYDKGGWVAWMMLDLIGRERMLAGLREFIEEYRNGPDYPVLQDFLAVIRRHAPDPEAFDAFAHQWFHQVVVPRYRLSEAAKVRLTGAVPVWEVKVTVKNEGTGRMPVEVAATTGGDRFTEEGKPGKGYHDARVTVVLGAGEEKQVTIRTPFEPKNVLADPDAKVLQLRRKSAVVKL